MGASSAMAADDIDAIAHGGAPRTACAPAVRGGGASWDARRSCRAGGCSASPNRFSSGASISGEGDCATRPTPPRRRAPAGRRTASAHRGRPAKARHSRAVLVGAWSSPGAEAERAAGADVLAVPPAGHGRQVVGGGHGDGIGTPARGLLEVQAACARTTARPSRRCRRDAGGRGSRAARCRDLRRSPPRRGDAISRARRFSRSSSG